MGRARQQLLRIVVGVEKRLPYSALFSVCSFLTGGYRCDRPEFLPSCPSSRQEAAGVTEPLSSGPSLHLPIRAFTLRRYQHGRFTLRNPSTGIFSAAMIKFAVNLR